MLLYPYYKDSATGLYVCIVRGSAIHCVFMDFLCFLVRTYHAQTLLCGIYSIWSSLLPFSPCAPLGDEWLPDGLHMYNALVWNNVCPCVHEYFLCLFCASSVDY